MNSQRIIDTSKVADSIQRFSNLSMELFADSLRNNFKMLDDMGNIFTSSVSQDIQKRKSSHCCPPEPECPPRCILEIKKEAYAGEVIVQPFMVKNQCNSIKTYRIGVREFKDQHGNESPVAAILNRNEIQLEPGQSISVLLSVNLSQEVQAGDCLSTDIVIREKEVNQNICFKLFVKPICDVPVAVPLKEAYYFNHWQSWQSHFYCENKPENRRERDLQISI